MRSSRNVAGGLEGRPCSLDLCGLRGKSHHCEEVERRFSDGKAERLHISDCKEKSALCVFKSNSHDCVEMEDLIAQHYLEHCVRLGSFLKGCLVVSGRVDFYYRHNPMMEWDTAAMQCIVGEASDIFRQMDDSHLHYNRKNSRHETGFYAINCMENKLR